MNLNGRMYTPDMRILRTPVLAFVCLGLLATQLTGLHMHADGHGYVGVPVGTHVHRTAAHADEALGIPHETDADHDHHRGDATHEGDRDVSVIELGAALAKISVFVIPAALGFVVVSGSGLRLHIPVFAARPKPRHEHWRPPLRAPPAFSLH